LDLLAGNKVLDLTTSIAGPYATLLLADMGASVVKIERPICGDDARAWGPPFLDKESLWFLSVNRNKKSVALDYTSPAGLAALHALVGMADVIIVNQVVSSQVKLGIDYKRLSALNPRLVHVSITGYGLTSEKCDQPCYDLIAEGYSGVMDLTGEPGTRAQKIGTPAADLLAGSDAAMSSIAALLARATTGRGKQIDVSMVESMTRFMTPRIVTFMGTGQLPSRSGGKDSVIAIYQAFDTADHPLTLGLGNDGIWQRFCKVIGRPDLAADARHSNNAGRRERRAELVCIIQAILSEQARDHWLAVFARARIPSGPINRLDEVVQDVDLQRRGLFYTIERDGVAIPQVGLGIHFDGSSRTRRSPPPRLGKDTYEVFDSWLSWDSARVDQFNVTAQVT
jgi:crotonobetainyl-CoA:carnitine CoA-transferase CaiB-like acyl-CoA transferase